MPIDFQNLLPHLLGYIWPMLRISGMVLLMPALSASFVPPQARILVVLALAILVAPISTPPVGLDVFSLETILVVSHELLLGIAMGFALKLVLDAVTLGGQSIAMSMGLGFAIFIDNARGVNVPVLGQFFLVLGTLIFLALDGHLRAIEMLVVSFQYLPVGAGFSATDIASQLLAFSSIVFTGAVRIALPAVTALLVVNIAFGVMSRAAPTLNLFAIGFPVSLLFGILAVMLTLSGFTATFSSLVDEALGVVNVFAVNGGQP